MAVRMPQVRPQDTLPLKANLLRDPLGGEVLDVGDQVEPLEVELVEGVPAEPPERARRGASASGFGRAPVADVAGLVLA